jgi:signal peptidase
MEFSNNYNGPSMNPTFLPGDGLKVAPYDGRGICCGDVVVFPDPNGNRNVVHRVVGVDSEGIRTKGDNNNKVDPWVLKPEDIIGRVISAHRGNRSLTVVDGKAGVLLSLILRKKRDLLKRLFIILHPLYRWLAGTGLFQTLFLPVIRPRIRCFNRCGGTELHLVLGSWRIGRRLPESDEWDIKRPFRLFVDVEKLKF